MIPFVEDRLGQLQHYFIVMIAAMICIINGEDKWSWQGLTGF